MQERALTTFVYHLSALGLEYWDYPQPKRSDNPCVQAIWRLSCYTYFPQSPLGCEKNTVTDYMRPCKSSCTNYIRNCGVECCDESVECNFTNKKTLLVNNETQVLTTTGYSDIDGPSLVCTGTAARLGVYTAWLVMALSSFFISGTGNRLIIPLAIAALISQGWDIDVPSHKVGNWRGQPDYLIQYQFIPPGSDATTSLLNSCSQDHWSQTVQCNGRGLCKAWDASNLDNPITFCDCDREWADPECRTERKSQVTAFFLSIFLGPLGVDQFYLGFPIAGSAKMVTLGGFGVWWLVDIVRTGSSPVYTYNYRVANDLPHWLYVFTVVTLSFLIGFCVSVRSVHHDRIEKRKAQMKLRSDQRSAEY